MTSVAPDLESSTNHDWQSLFKQTELYARNQINRLHWRGSSRSLLPDGYDPNSIAAEAFAELFQQPLPNNGTPPPHPINAELQPDDLRKDLRRRVRKLVDRLHHRSETSLLRNEADLAPIQLDDGETVPFWETVPAPDRTPVEVLIHNENAGLENFKKGFDAFLGRDLCLRRLFAFNCAGIFKPKALASKLKLKPRVVINRQKRLRARLTQFLNARIPRANQNFLQKSVKLTSSCSPACKNN